MSTDPPEQRPPDQEADQKPEPQPEPQNTSVTNDTAATRPKPKSRWTSAILWVLAVLLMLAAIVYQRRTGPTHPMRGSITLDGAKYRYKLIRSEETIRDAEVKFPKLKSEEAHLHLFYKRFKTDDAFQKVAFQSEGEYLIALLPAQPAAGKLEYYLIINQGDESTRIPESTDENVIIRFKDPVPMYILIPHIFMMFFSVLFGLRAGLGAVWYPDGIRRLSWTVLIGITLGGMILGPIVQKYAFGAYWTGFPWGGDLTDNKTLFMWLGWLLACSTLGLKPKKNETPARLVVVAATIVMMVVYLIPHSMQGSELDYDKLDKGMDPKQAIGTGD